MTDPKVKTELENTAAAAAVSAVRSALSSAGNEYDNTDSDAFEKALKKKLTDTMQDAIMQRDTLRKLQLTELEILTKLDAVCRANGLTYYIVGGTLIGAVRHSGFVPWDDDIDVSMPRRDFERLIELSKTELDGYTLQTHKTDKRCYFFYAKLRKNGTYFGEDKFEHTPIHKGIFIDIFPLDFIPDSGALQKLLFRGFSCINGFICSKKKTGEFLYKNMSLPFIVSFRLLQCILPTPLLYGLRSLIAKTSNALSRKRLLCSLSGFHGYPGEIAPAQYWGTGTDIEFEGRTVRAPEQYDTLLKHMFGDYMQLPPEDERVCHDVDSASIRFDGCTESDYAPRIKRKRSHRYYGCDYDILPIRDKAE